jgi:cytochrome c-type biogenesis protein CcmE
LWCISQAFDLLNNLCYTLEDILPVRSPCAKFLFMSKITGMTQLTQPAQTIPADLAEQKTSTRSFKFIIAGLLVVALIIGLIVQATIATGAYYLTVDEVHERAPNLYGERVRVNGLVVDDSENWNPQGPTLRFAIVDEEDQNGSQLEIVFDGPRPDNFQRAASAIIEGQLLPDGSFQADTLLLKCPSRYDEEPEEIFVRAER